MSDVWHITNQDENTTDVPEEENMVVLEGVMGYWCLWYGGATPEPIFWENVKKWCYLDDLLALETELERTRKALDVAVDALKRIKDECYDTTDVLLYVNKALEQITALEQKD